MPRKLKVFGGLTFGARHQQRTIVAATSQAKAAELVGVSMSDMRGYWCETGNEIELATALAAPGRVFRASDSQSKDFRPAALNGRTLADDLEPPKEK